MNNTLKVLSALLSYPTPELQAAMPELRRALDAEGALASKQRDRLDRIMEEIASDDIYDLQERYILLFDRTRSLSLHLFEHVHGESRDRGQAMVDLSQHYAGHDFEIAANELPDYLPLFIEFLSLIPPAETRGLIGETAHVLEAIRLRLKKRKSAYSSVFSGILALVDRPASKIVTEAIAGEAVDNPDDLAALDKAWMDEEVLFGPTALVCGKDHLSAKLRAGFRPASGVPVSAAMRPTVSVNGVVRR